MCAVNGYTKGSAEKRLREMNAATAHRGPDGSDVFEDEYVAIGHNLLALRANPEISQGPFSEEASPFVLSYNGQIYNVEDIKKLLPSSLEDVMLDTILLFELIKKFGWKGPSYASGMFALALYNRAEKKIGLFRDSTGEKPLYYYRKNKTFIWSSEIKGILAHLIDRSVDHEAITLAELLGYIPGDRTLFAHIKKVRPGECVMYDLKSNTLERREIEDNTTHHLEGNFGDVIRKVVQSHLESTATVILNASGGLDSSLLAYEMSELGYKLHTYSTQFANCSDIYNEDAGLAKRLAKDLRAVHTELLITPALYLEHMIESIKLVEEPNYNISLPVYRITAYAEGRNGAGHRALFSGDGGDEVFGGYDYYRDYARMFRLRKRLTSWLYTLLKNKRNHMHYDFSDAVEAWLSFKALSHPQSRAGALRLAHLLKGALPYDGKELPRDAIQSAMVLDRYLWLAGENFIRNDKLYMNESLEVRAPLSYEPFRAYMDTILAEKDYTKEGTGKAFVRKYYTDKLPDYIVKRPRKTGWRAPISEWYDKAFKDRFLEILSERALANHNAVNWKQLMNRIEREDSWPGKQVHIYLSLAVLGRHYNLPI